MPDRLAEIRALLAASTPGPWLHGTECGDLWGPDGALVISTGMHEGNHENDLNLIAAAPALLAWAADEVERLREIIRDVHGPIFQAVARAHGTPIEHIAVYRPGLPSTRLQWEAEAALKGIAEEPGPPLPEEET